MNAHRYRSIVTCLFLLTIFAVSLYAQKENSVLEKSQLLYKQQKYLEALDILEPEYIKQPIKYNYKYNLWSTEEYLQRLYILSAQQTRGVQVLYKIYLQTTSTKKNSRSKLEKVLFDLSLNNKNFDISREILSNQRKREKYAGWDLNEARLLATQGDTRGALALLSNYMTNKYAESQNRILVIPEFIPLHGDSTFQSLMTYTKEQYQAKQQQWKQEREKMNQLLGKDNTISCNDVPLLAETYKKVVDIQSGQNLQEELKNADTKIQQNLLFTKL